MHLKHTKASDKGKAKKTLSTLHIYATQTEMEDSDRIGTFVGIGFGVALLLALIIFFLYRKCRRNRQVETRLVFSDYVRTIALQDKERMVSLAHLARMSSPRMAMMRESPHFPVDSDNNEELLLSPRHATAAAAAATPRIIDESHHHEENDEEAEELSFASLSRIHRYQSPKSATAAASSPASGVGQPSLPV